MRRCELGPIQPLHNVPDRAGRRLSTTTDRVALQLDRLENRDPNRLKSASPPGGFDASRTCTTRRRAAPARPQLLIHIMNTAVHVATVESGGYLFMWVNLCRSILNCEVEKY